MATFEQHLQQAKNNLIFLKEINDKSKFFDWQVTTCFYTAVHLINAHLAKCADLHYKTHEETKIAINPDNPLSMCKIEEGVFDKYVSLEKLSRRARYLCNDTGAPDDHRPFLTFEKHVSTAMSRLNTIMTYFNTTYGTAFTPIPITCPKVKAELPKTLAFFTVEVAV